MRMVIHMSGVRTIPWMVLRQFELVSGSPGDPGSKTLVKNFFLSSLNKFSDDVRIGDPRSTLS